MKPCKPRSSFPRAFTLVELLVTITIILVLATLAFFASGRVMSSAYQTRSIGQMKSIGTAVAMWASEHNNDEPMYFSNGSGDYSEEGALTGKISTLAPGNPAKLLYKKDDIANSYVQDHTVFFSPLTTFEPPSRYKYDPDQASSQNPWGTYAWLYPSTTSITERQKSAMGGFSNTKIGREAYGNLIMGSDYRGVVQPRYKRFYHALFRDGSVRYIGDSASKWTTWLRGENE